MNQTAQYEQDVERQVKAMLALAESSHPDFRKHCLSDPGEIVSDWRQEVDIEYVGSITHTQLHEEYVPLDDQSDLLGLFTPIYRSKLKGRIQIQFDKGDNTARRNFTLLHELGHYLQQTNDELADNLIRISSSNFEKRFEEDACNRFASIALLPDDVVHDHIGSGNVTADVLRTIFEAGRDKAKGSKRLRVSRPVVVRRLVQFMSKPGSIALVCNDDLKCRIDTGKHITYDGDLTAEEQAILAEFLKPREHSGYCLERCLTSSEGKPLAASVSSSYSGGRKDSKSGQWQPNVYYFIVIAEQ